MANFANFYDSLDADPSKRGKQFEHFVKWFLKADPEWSTQVDQVWLWDEYPGRWGVDCGIDLVFRHKNGHHWAVQAKCYSPDYSITKQDVDKFLSESNRPNIKHRLLIATTDRIGANAKQVCDGQEKPVRRFLLSHFDLSALDYPANFAQLAQAGRRKRPTPRDHQNEARTSVVHGLQTADRGQLIMACGTGKTYVTLWIKEELDAQRTLVLVPSLGLLSQLLREWTFAATTRFEVLCVCSDQTVGTKDTDDAIHSVADLAFPVTSDVDEVKDFLSRPGYRVVFSTYQSSRVIAEAQASAATPAFDLTVADEAHRCAGKVESEFSIVLDNAQIRSTKRLFATATPRTYSSHVKKAAEDRGCEVVGMDDAAVFGDVLYSLPFGKAIEKNLLTDYRVVIIGVDDPTIAGWIADRELVTTGTGIETDSESLAAQIGLLKAIKEYDLKRIISFHSRVNRAETFTNDMQKTVEWVSDEHRPSGILRTDYVSGKMTANARKIKLDQLKAIGADERALLSNARCLSEGVDVPSLDGVAFIDPRRSQVDIIQAVGRAIRLSPDKKAGTIVLPVFIAAGQNAADTIEASHFKPIWDVLNALKAHDDVLAGELDQLRIGLGKKPGLSISADGMSKIMIDLPATVDAAFANALRTHLVEQVTESWGFWFGLLQAFAEREGHAKVPVKFMTADGYRLGTWVNGRRTRRDRMSPERQAQMEAVPGWTWAPFADVWDERFRSLKEFADREGHTNVSPGKSVEGSELVRWVVKQRTKKDVLSRERQARLEALPGWSWDALASRWEERFRSLKEFVRREGHAKVPKDFQTTDGCDLGSWVNTQRVKADKMPPERKARLEAIPGWSWGPRADSWEEVFRSVQEFAAREGHCSFPSQSETEEISDLGKWANKQRTNKGKMSPERQSLLETLPGWRWDPRADWWDQGFYSLTEFVVREGHAKVSRGFKTGDGYALGAWVNAQRTNKGKMSPGRQARLEALPGWSWDPREDSWEEGFRHLRAFADREGHARVPSSFITEGGYALGTWVNSLRTGKDKLSRGRQSQLETLPGWTWDARADWWEEGFRSLKEFAVREGHCSVPSEAKTEYGYSLSRWVSTQRTKKNEMSRERQAQLETLPSWSWAPFSDVWEDSLRSLKEFADREGHAKVPKGVITAGGIDLGSWVGIQRAKRDNMSLERKARLEALPCWTWDPRADSWEEGFRHLKEFADRKGHAKVTSPFKTADGYGLSTWLTEQRTGKEKMSRERRALLEALPGWSWAPQADSWDEGFRHLQEFAGQEGHANVPVSYKTDDGYRLGVWANSQRTKRDKMSPQLKAQLDSIPGWRWDVLASLWQEGFRYLKEFADREGHTKVIASFKTADGYGLGSWVSTQRTRKDKLSPDRKALLETLRGWSWDALASKWEEGFRSLKEFSGRTGHTKVPKGYRTADGYRLGTWVNNLRAKAGRISPERRATLESLPGWSW